MIVLEDNGVEEFMKPAVPMPQDPQQLAQHTKNDVKARRIILEGVKDHIVPHIHEKKTTYEMYDTILKLYQSTNDTRKLAVKEKLRSIWMKQGKAKGKKGKGKGEPSQKGDKKDLSKIKCFRCHDFGHYANKCPNWKKGSNKEHVGASTKVDGFAIQFEKDFSLIACMASSLGSNMWYIDSGASFHMTGNKEYFSQLEEKDLQVHIELGDNDKYANKGVGTVNFERESGSSLHLRDVLYVPWLKKNLVLVATLNDKEYDVIFNRGKAYLKHLASGSVKQIGVNMKNLYRLQVETCATLSNKVDGEQSRDTLAQVHGTLAS
eukprot:PITA_12830